MRLHGTIVTSGRFIQKDGKADQTPTSRESTPMTQFDKPNDTGIVLAEPDTPRVSMSPKVQDSIGRALEAHYGALVLEPIPERLLDLLKQLEAGDLSHE